MYDSQVKYGTKIQLCTYKRNVFVHTILFKLSIKAAFRFNFGGAVQK